MKDAYGFVIGQSNPNFFEFNITNPEIRPSNYEYVQVKVEEQIVFNEGKRKEVVDVLAQVKQVISRHPFYDEKISPSAAWKQEQLGFQQDLLQIIAVAKIIGFLQDLNGKKEILHPRSPPLPGTPVYRAEDQLVKSFFDIAEEDVPLPIGYLLHRPNIVIPVSGKELHRHTAILAMTRYGKSYVAGKIIEELLKKGATVVVVDAHGDYINMYRRPDGGLNEFFKDKITVYVAPGAEKISSPLVTKPFKFSVSEIGFSELCQLAKITGSLQKILLRRVLKEAREKNREFSLEDVIDLFTAKMEEESIGSEERKRISKVLLRLEELSEKNIFSEFTTPIKEFFKPMHASILLLSGLDGETQDVFVGLVLRKIFDAKFKRENWAKYPVFIFVEEAHRFAAPPEKGGGRFSREIISKISSEGSKFGVFLVIISQRPRKIDQDILANCSNYIILRMVNREDQLTIKAASESFSEDLLDDLPALNQGEAVLLGPFVPAPVMIKTGGRETDHGGRTPDIHRLLEEAREEMDLVKLEGEFSLH